MNALETANAPHLEAVPSNTDTAAVMQILERDGAVILEDLLTEDQVARLNADLDSHLERHPTGGINSTALQFFGDRTKRFTNLVTLSKTFREEILEHDIVLRLTDAILLPHADSYWMCAAQIIELHPGEILQPLHRDLSNFPFFRTLGSAGPEVVCNFIIALKDFREEVGATRVIPGSHKWEDFENVGSQDQTIAAEMRPGSALFGGGKVVHGGGANVTKDRTRRALAFAFNLGWLVPEEAYPFTVPLELARSLSPRAQQLLGFRSFHNESQKGTTLWGVHFQELAHFLKLD